MPKYNVDVTATYYAHSYATITVEAESVESAKRIAYGRAWSDQLVRWSEIDVSERTDVEIESVNEVTEDEK